MAIEIDCEHGDAVQDVTPNAQGCAQCLAIGDRWVHLRMCLTCGNVGCCDDSKNKHASGHFRTVGHPLVQSFEPDEEWIWCYVDDAVVGEAPTLRTARRRGRSRRGERS
ncbi:MAG: UBP-type zinc finger domain-containing protein [Chloroflexi bacterium]|nr:UBP-type zinc finger domain-containing protein [Chloroflexota bacterium]